MWLQYEIWKCKNISFSKPSENEESAQIFYKQLRATTDNKKFEIFKTFLDDTTKVNKNAILELN